jgi:glycosyltransferase involved in cell wall biosynthesis
MNSGSCKVSVCVITYNHELYIAQCLQSIVDQRCSFNFEIVIRDDCSQDGTLEIIKIFQARYPEIIRLLNAEKNIGANKNILVVFSAAKGEYLALCEGDDYWLDTQKLEKQLAVMESQPELTFTAHPCWIHEKDGLTKTAYIKSTGNLEITCKDVLAISGQFAPTASYMFRRELLEYLPSWFGDAPVGDFFIEMYGIAMGRGLYLPEPMSVYRTYSVNSWTSSNNEKNSANLVAFSKVMVDCLMSMQAEEKFFDVDFSRKLAASNFNMATGSLLMRSFPDFKEAIVKCRKNFPGLSLTQTVLYRLKDFPLGAYLLYKLKRKLY